MAIASTLSNHSILVPMGHLEYRVVSQMSAMGEAVVVIEFDPRTELVSTVPKIEVPIIQNDTSAFAFEGTGTDITPHHC